MTNKEALERAMDKLVSHGDIVVARAKAKGLQRAKATEADQAEADKDAEAWNMLRHLSRIL